MPRVARSLTESQVLKLTKQGRHTVAQGLYVRIVGSRRYYEARVTDRYGKRSWKAIGNVGVISLQQARRIAEDLREAKGAAKGMGTFADAAAAYLKTHSAGWNEVHRRQWDQTLRDYILPTIGNIPVDRMTPADIVRIVGPIWTTKNETARRIRGRIENVIDFALAGAGLVAANPADKKFISKLVPKVAASEEHHAAPEVEQLRALLHSLDTDYASHRCLWFTALTLCRTSEARLADWSEIDGDLWTIPAERMKSGRVHRVPLAPAASKILGQRPKGGGSIFGDLSLNAMRAVLIKRNLPFTIHGIRACFRSWAAREGAQDAVAEMCLAHVVGSKVERAYQRDDLLDARRKLLLQWAKVLL